MSGTRMPVRSLFVAVIMLAVVLLLSPKTYSADGDCKAISTDQLKAMLDGKKELVLIDTRTKEEYQEAHIPGAISIPEKSFEGSASLLPPDKNALLVLYCNGVKCGKSKKAAIKAAAMGYTHTSIYAEGFAVWEEKGLKIVAGPDHEKKVETTMIKPAELKGLIDARSGDIVIVDVRDESEFREGHIPTAVNIPVETFAMRSEVLPKEKMVVVYCNTGGRSYNAYRKLMKLAYPNIAQTTYAEWNEAKMAVER